MEQYPSLSILSTFKDSKDMLKTVMDSVLIQEYPSIEHIIIDAASTDGSVDLLEEYSIKYKIRKIALKYKSEPDKCAVDGYRKAANFMTGDYFICLTNPLTMPQSLGVLMEYLVKTNCDAVSGGIYFIKNGIIIRRWSGRKGSWRLGWMAAAETVCFKRSIYEKHGLFDDKYINAFDYDFQVRLFKDKDIRFESIKVPITNFIAGGISNGTLAQNIIAIKEDYEILRSNYVRLAWFTLLCKCIRAFCGYAFASRNKMKEASNYD